jgi:hypothetical protein
MKKHSFPAGFVAMLSLLYGTSALAVNEQITFSQTLDGSVLATLSGGVAYCGDYFVGSPTFAVSGNDITITSTTAPGECPQPPPGFQFPPPTPYSFTVNLGHLPDGTFHVTWQFVAGANSVWKRTLALFALSHGTVIPLAVPLFSSFVSLSLIAAIGVIALSRLGPERSDT